MGQVRGEMGWQLLEVALDQLLEEALHVVGLEGRTECCHLVDDAAEAPDVTLVVVGLVLPDLRRGVVRSASLRVIQAQRVGDFRDVHVTQLGDNDIRSPQVSLVRLSIWAAVVAVSLIGTFSCCALVFIPIHRGNE